METVTKKLLCPSCHKDSVTYDDKIYSCLSCKQAFPTVNKIPWLFSNPDSSKIDWINRFNFYQQVIENEISKLKLELLNNKNLPLTEKRLNKLIQAKVEHRKEVIKLLEPLGLKSSGTIEHNLAFSTKLPATQTLMSYYSNVCRDWAYGDEENEICLNIILDILDKNLDLGEVITLGAGACRLPYDIFRHTNCKSSLSVDINPYLMLAGQRVISGKNLSLFEFPIAPLNMEATAVKLKVKAPEVIKDDFYFIFSDAMNPSFKDSSFDTVITPWLIDIVHQDIRDYFRRFNRILRKGGRWINFGSLSFFHSKHRICYSLEEPLELIEQSGFKLLKWQQEEIPYLNSPYSGQNRRETVLTFCAEKVSEVEQPEAFQFLPAWLTDSSLAVPSNQDFIQQYGVHQTLSKVFQLIDGKKSIDDMAQILGKDLGISIEHTSQMLSNLLGKFYEDRLKGRQF